MVSGSYGFGQLRQDLVDREPLRSTENNRALVRHQKDVQTLDKVMRVSRNQRSIIDQDLDLRTLSSALRRFPQLQQIRLMRVDDRTTEDWNQFLSRQDEEHAEGFRPKSWTVSFQRSATVLSSAATHLQTPLTRFSSRFMAPPLPLVLTEEIHARITDFVGHLTGLDQEFNERAQVSENIIPALSSLFALVWNSAHSLQALHIGLYDSHVTFTALVL